MVYDRAHTRDIPSLSGFGKKMPFVAVAFVVGGLVSMGMPGLSGFIAEFPIFMGVWKGPVFAQAGLATITSIQPPLLPSFGYFTVIAILSALGIIITAGYVLRVTQQVFAGEFDEKKFPEVTDVTMREKLVIVLLASTLIIIGIAPTIMTNMVEAGMMPIVTLLKGG
jgi:NADH-quinone oxidoreductase subunit M